VLQHSHRQLADVRLVGIGRAAVEIDHPVRVGFRLGAREAPGLLLPPAAEGVARPPWQRPARRHLEDLLDDQAQEAVAHAEVRQRREGCPQAAPQLVAAQEPVARRHAVRLGHARLGLGVDLHHLDAVRADQRADAAAGAVIDRVIGRRLARLAQALRLGADGLRPGEQRRQRRDGARRRADVALQAVIRGEGRFFDQV